MKKSPWRWAMKRNQCNRGINREKLTEKKWKMSFKWRSTINLSPIEIGGEKQWYMSCCCCWWGSVGEMYTGSTSRLHAMYTLPITSSNHYFYYGDLYCLNLSIVTWTCKGPLSQKHCPFFGGGHYVQDNGEEMKDLSTWAPAIWLTPTFTLGHHKQTVCLILQSTKCTKPYLP